MLGPATFLSAIFAISAIGQTLEQQQPPEGWCFFYNINGCKCRENPSEGMSMSCQKLNFDKIPDLIEYSSWQSLDFSRNQLKLVPKYQFANVDVQQVDLSQNGISSIHENAFAMSQKIQTLRLNDNQLTSISDYLFLRLPNLRILDISGNPLTSVNFNAILPLTKRLDTLAISRVPKQVFGQLKLNSPSSLRNLIMKQNGFTELAPNAFAQLPELRSIDLAQNNLSTIPNNAFAAHFELTNVNLSGNAFKTVPEIRSRSINDLDLSMNNLSELQMYSFAETPSLSNIRLAKNRIGRVDEDVFCGLEGNLSKVDLSHNQLKTFSACALNSTKADGRQILDLEFNQIECNCTIPPLAQSPSWSIVLSYCRNSAHHNSTLLTTTSVQNYIRNNTCNGTELKCEATIPCDPQRRKFVKSKFQTKWKVTPIQADHSQAISKQLNAMLLMLITTTIAIC